MTTVTAKETFALLIYRIGDGEPPPDRVDDVLVHHRELQRETSERGELHAVAKLDDKREAKSVRLQGSAHEVTDGPYIETKEWLVGFYLIDCVSFDEAVERAKLLCATDDHAIEVRPVGWHNDA